MKPFLLKAGKVCLILVAAISIVYLGPTTNSVWALDSITVVTIKGRVAGGTVQVKAEASGTASSLGGFGTDSPINGLPKGQGPKGYCRFPLTGSLSGSKVTLSGVVSFSNVPSNIGTPVTIKGDASNGSIIFNFGGTILTGTGSVVIASQ